MYTKTENDFYFEKMQDRIYNTYKSFYLNTINNATDKDYAKEFHSVIDMIQIMEFYSNPFIKEVVSLFNHSYKLGLSIDSVLADIPRTRERHLRNRADDMESNKKTNHLKDTTGKHHISLTNETSSKYLFGSDMLEQSNPKYFLKVLVRYFATARFIFEMYPQIVNENDDVFDKTIFPFTPKKEIDKTVVPDVVMPDESTIVLPPENPNIASNLKWTGKSKTEFVQLIYAIYHAKLINNNKDEITKIVEDMAKVFNYDIGDNWQDLLSKSVNNRKNGYVPKIFENLKNAFIEYYESRH